MTHQTVQPEEFTPGELPQINDPGNEDPGSDLENAPVPLRSDEEE